MPRLLRLTVILCLLLSAGIGSALLLARANNAKTTLQAAGFDTCNGVPCFMGITPGVTTWGDGEKILTYFGQPDKKERQIEVSTGDNKSHFRLTSSPDFKSVAYI